MDSTNFVMNIGPVENNELQDAVQTRLDDLTKPKGSLGRLEEIVTQYCLCRKRADASIKTMTILTFAGDHGITEEKITPYPKEVTVQMVRNMVAGGAAISVLCENGGITSKVVDIGTAGDFTPEPGLLIRKIAPGTRNFLQEPAMTEAECRKAMEAGYALAEEEKADLFGIGEMGIGNTSSASALYSLLLDVPARETTGVGTGSTGELLEHKIDVVERAAAFHRQEWNGDPLEALRRVGGFELAGMTGLIFGAAAGGVPVVVDGFISSAAALVAMQTHAPVKEYLFFSHASSEKFHNQFLYRLSLHPLLDLGMRLGEGTGAALAMHIISQALNCYHGMASFSQAGVATEE
jgi:nicotinate-nucleotide--dimethylbenzimidazole phosphoribosyltransferase